MDHRLAIPASELSHSTGGGVEVAINPGIFFIEPDAAETVLAPTGRIWPNDLLSWVLVQELTRTNELEFERLARGSADEVFEE
jgi:hypothetical protein